ncbi:MAG TPA: two-component regulator propeller domain-containing protein [Pyrinomonadaceae bacterium]|nr:two-component regulator propeller domain-containing protein [Pyrinomonadaceae bacterium]
MTAGRRKGIVGRRGATRLGLLFSFCLLSTVYCLLSTLPLPTAYSLAQNEPASLHRWGAVTLFHGLPSDQVRAVAQDAEGVMWFGTDAGLARYDGRRVQSVTSEGLAGPRVRALAVGPDGALWVGADGGAFVRPPGSQEFRRVEETRGKTVLAVSADGPGRALLSTADGLVYGCVLEPNGRMYANQVATQLTAATGKLQPIEVSSVLLLEGTVVAGTRGRGLMTMKPVAAGLPGEAKEVAAKPRAFYVEALARDSAGALFFGAKTSAADSGLFKVEVTRDKNEVALRPSKVAGVATGKVTALAAAPDGELYAGTEARGVFRLRDGRVVERFTFAGTAGGLRSDTVNAVFVDREGVVWFGTPRGVCRYDPRGVRVEQLSEVSESNFIRTLYRTPSGRLLAGTSRGLFARDDASGGAWHEVEEVAGKTVYAVAENHHGLLLVGTNAGLFVGLQTEGLKERSPVRLAPEEKAEDNVDKRPAEAPEQKPPAGGEGRVDGSEKQPGSVGAAPDEKGKGVSKGGDGTREEAGSGEKGAEAAQTKKVAEPALSGSVRAIARFAGGVYVASYGRGLERFLGPGRRELVWPRAGQDERGREVVSLYADESRGRLWVGTANAGVFYFDGATVKAEPALAPLGKSTVWGVSYAEGWLWLATSRGLYALGPNGRFVALAGGVDARSVVATEGGGAPQAWCVTAGVGLLRVTLDEQFGPVASRLGTEQGLPTDNAFAVLRERDGAAETLLVGTTRGLVRYEPGTLAPVLRLMRVTSSRAIQPEELRGGALRLQYPQNGLALDVAAAASRTFPEQFLYAFTLRDEKGQVIKQKLSRDSQFQTESLAAGAYTVTARAYTLDLVASDTLKLNFEVARAPFPRTIVALSVLLAIASAALVWALLQHRRVARSRGELQEANHQLAAARLQLASEAEAERRRIARDLHDQTLADLRRLLLLADEMQPPPGTATPPGSLLSATATVTDAPRLRAEIESISQEVRRICEDLSPSVLENVGFAAALEWAVATACAQQPAARRFTYDFLCDEHLEERLALAPGVQMQVYRIVQEAVSNVCRHADAGHVSLSVHLDDAGDFVLQLSDDGRGFDADHKREPKGRGLAGIRARASLIEAEAAWSRREGGGTVFTLRKPDAARAVGTAAPEGGGDPA